MQFDDFDVDALLDAQSSDDDGNDLPELERSLDDILNDDEFADVLGHTVPVKPSAAAHRVSSDNSGECLISRLDGELLDSSRDGLEFRRNGELSDEEQGGTWVPDVLREQNGQFTETEHVVDTRDEKFEWKFTPKEDVGEGFPGFVGTEIRHQESGETQSLADDTEIDTSDTRRFVTGSRHFSNRESNERLSVPILLDSFTAAAMGSNFKGRPGAALAAAASLQIGSFDSTASKFAKTFPTRQKSLFSGTSEDNRPELDTVTDNTFEEKNSKYLVHLRFPNDDLDDNRIKLDDEFDTTVDVAAREVASDEVYSTITEERLDRVEKLSSTLEILEQRLGSSSSLSSSTGREHDGADEVNEPQSSVLDMHDGSSSEDASEADDEDIDGFGARELVTRQHPIHLTRNTANTGSDQVATIQSESSNLDTLNNWADDTQNSMTTSTPDGQPLSSETSAVRSLTDSDEEGEAGKGLVDQPDSVVVKSQKSVDMIEEERTRTTLQLAEESEKRAASSGLHWEEGAVAQPMRLEGIQRGAPAIGLLQVDSGGPLNFALKSAALRRDHGTPQALAVHSNFIAIGMSKGPVLIIPSKYSATKSADETDAQTKPYILIPAASEKHQMGVSSMSFNQQGDLLLVGYSNGHIILWDVPKGSVGKHIEKDSGAPVVHAVFVGQDVAASRAIRAITADSRGLTLLHSFTQIPFVRRVSHNSSVLLDGQRTGLVLSIAPLLLDEGGHMTGGTNFPPSGMSSSPLNLGTVMSVVGGGANGDVVRKFLYDGASASEEGGGLVVLATNQTALVVRLVPSLVVCARFTRPEGIRDGAIPYTAWRRTKGVTSGTTSASVTVNASGDPSQNALPKGTDGRPTENGHNWEDAAVEAGTAKTNGDGSENLPVLAMAWDKRVIVLQLLKAELKIVAQWELDSTAIGVAWLEQEMVVVATSKDELCLFTNEGFEIERAVLTNEHGGLGAVTYHTHFLNIYGNPEKAYHNSLAVRGAALYLLGPSQLWRARLLPWRDRIKALQNAGDSLGAFHIAMEIYDGRCQGVTGLPRGLGAMREAIMPTLLALLSSYIDEAFAYLSLAFGSSPPGSTDAESASVSMTESEKQDVVSAPGSGVARDSAEDMAVAAREQYARVGGVAIEFCVHIHKTEVLFENVFSKFDAVGQRGTFLELLEPYILKDMLGGLAPEVMQALVEHYSSRGWLNRVEQCVLHMDIASLDFNQVVRVCRDHGLYSALIYLFTKGLDDFKSPLEELLVVAQHSNDLQQARGYGLKLLVYVKYCFSGLAFPPGNGTLSAARLPQLRTELLEYLLEAADSKIDGILGPEELACRYSRLVYLLTLDTQATLQVLGAAFPEDGPLGIGKRDCVYPLMRTKSEEDALNNLFESEGTLPNEESITEGLRLAQMTVDAIIHVLQTVKRGKGICPASMSEEEALNTDDVTEGKWPSEEQIGDMFEFLAYFAAGKYAVVPAAVLARIFVYLTSSVSEKSETMEERKKLRILSQREELMLAVLKAVPKSDWDAERTLDLARMSGFWQVTAFLHAETGDFAAALESYLKDGTRPQDPFTFISSKLALDSGLRGFDLADFRECVLSHVPELIQLSPVSTLIIVLKHFSEENQHILTALAPHPRLLFSYMKAIMNIRAGGFGYSEKELKEKVSSRQAQHGVSSGHSQPPSSSDHREEGSADHSVTESQSYLADLLERSSLEFTDEMAENFVELLCRFEPKSVLPFLESYENYRLEHCLKVCQEYGITDAATFLLERVGDVASALSLVLADVQILLLEMDQALAKFFSLPTSSEKSHSPSDDEVKNKPEVKAVNSVLSAAIALCQRNTFRLEPRESETLWFRLLDRFVEPLRDINLKTKGSRSRTQPYTKSKYKSSSPSEVSGKKSFSWKVLGNDLAVQTVRNILVQFIGDIVNGMMGFVPISVTMGKILEDHGGHEFGDFKVTILDMLSAYGYERAILGTANKLIEDDTFRNVHALRHGCSHAFIPSANTCSVCGLPLDELVDPSPLPPAAGAVGTKASSSTQNSEKQKGKIDDDSGPPPSVEYRLRVRIFPCGHATHYGCVDADSGSKKRNTTSVVVCPICSYRGQHIDISPKTNDATLLTDTVIEVGARKSRHHDSSNLSHLGRMHKTTSRIFGKSRLEILKQLERGIDLHELGPSVELSLAPPVLTPYKRPALPPPASSGSASGRVTSKSSLTAAVLNMQRKNRSRAR